MSKMLPHSPSSSHTHAHHPKHLRLTKQGGVATILWLHHWTRMWSSEEIQTFPNLSMNKLATLRAADRPFIVAGAGPMASVDRAAVLWFSVRAAMIDELQKGAEATQASQYNKSSPLCPPVQPQLHLHGPHRQNDRLFGENLTGRWKERKKSSSGQN